MGGRTEVNRGIINRLIETGANNPQRVELALNAAVLLLLAVMATGGFVAFRDSIYGQRVGQQIGALVQPALQAFTEATQTLGQQITSGPTAPPK